MELLKKLRINADQPVWLINLPDSCRHLFETLEIKEKTGTVKPVGQLILFCTDSAMLAHELVRLADYVGVDTLCWICYPKKTGTIPSDLIMMKSWDILGPQGYRGQTSASIDNDWSGLRVTNAPRTKHSDCDLPMEERKAEGIDYVNRTAQLPADALAAVNKYDGLNDFFQAMAFTHKKEYVMAITDAKKPETRVRRIEKTVEMLLEKMQAASLKKKTGAKAPR